MASCGAQMKLSCHTHTHTHTKQETFKLTDHREILQIKPNWCPIFLSMFISFLYVFQATMWPSSGEKTFWYAGCIPDSHPYRI